MASLCLRHCISLLPLQPCISILLARTHARRVLLTTAAAVLHALHGFGGHGLQHCSMIFSLRRSGRKALPVCLRLCVQAISVASGPSALRPGHQCRIGGHEHCVATTSKCARGASMTSFRLEHDRQRRQLLKTLRRGLWHRSASTSTAWRGGFCRWARGVRIALGA